MVTGQRSDSHIATRINAAAAVTTITSSNELKFDTFSTIAYACDTSVTRQWKLCERLVANAHIASIPLIVLAGDDAIYQKLLTGDPAEQKHFV